MPSLADKTDRYETMLTDALDGARVVVPPESPLGAIAADFEEMARSYLKDGRHFRAEDDDVNALAAFAYGHAWLDAGARLGVFDVSAAPDLFTV